jgi:hypothetical protein
LYGGGPLVPVKVTTMHGAACAPEATTRPHAIATRVAVWLLIIVVPRKLAIEGKSFVTCGASE